MKRLFVAIPPKYDITLDDADAHLGTYRARSERLAYEAEQKIGEYCEIVRCSFNDMLKDPKYEGSEGKFIREFIADAIVCLGAADYAVFPDDWRTSKECSLLHDIAEALDIPILEVFG